ncbi:MAG: DUF1684 domain-containing protein [Dehalococcoidia bacterium]
MEAAIDRGAAGYLDLADWRRRIADLYAEVRQRASTDPAAAFRYWCTTRARLYHEHPQSPVPPSERVAFRLSFYDYDPALRFELPILAEPFPGRDEKAGMSDLDQVGAAEPGSNLREEDRPVPTSSGGSLLFRSLGWIPVPFPNGSSLLRLLWLDNYAGGLFLSFQDATNGVETYGGGRYLLDTAKGADLGGDLGRGALVVDFNFAYQPSCAFDPRWACPLTPPENRLAFPLPAGERIA